MKTITEIYYKMKPFTGNSSQLVLILKTLSDHIFGGERWSTMDCVLTLFLSHISRESSKPQVEFVCSRQYQFSVIWSSVLISVT